MALLDAIINAVGNSSNGNINGDDERKNYHTADSFFL